MTAWRVDLEEMTNDKWHFEKEEENFTLVALRCSGRSSADGMPGFLFFQANHIFVF
jgi:hypothetical protein